jgi:putative ABC transport system substrate-binding protein
VDQQRNADGSRFTLRRRDFIAVLGGGAVGWPFVARAQQPDRRLRVGVLMAFPRTDPLTEAATTAFAKALRDLGWVESENLQIDYRFAAGDPVLFKTYASELVALSPDVILASTPPAIDAVRQQTRTIPIVFVFVIDPIGLGLVQSLARPGGNTTGFGSADPALMGKWVQLLKEIAPKTKRVGIIFNPATTIAPAFNAVIEATAPTLGITPKHLPVHDDAEIAQAIATEAREPDGSLITLPDSFNIAHRAAIIAAATQRGLPLMGLGEFFPRSGALMSYFFDPVHVYAEAASYIDRILKGASPADLPVQQPTKYSLVINLKTAKALGLTVPPSILARADEVIE